MAFERAHRLALRLPLADPSVKVGTRLGVVQSAAERNRVDRVVDLTVTRRC